MRELGAAAAFAHDEVDDADIGDGALCQAVDGNGLFARLAHLHLRCGGEGGDGGSGRAAAVVVERAGELATTCARVASGDARRSAEAAVEGGDRAWEEAARPIW